MTELARKRCVPCEGGVPRITGATLALLTPEVPAWRVVDEHHLERVFVFPDFASALAFVNQVGALAESEGHHPNLTLSWGRVEVQLWTHAIDGLSENDFILAAKIDELTPH